MSDDGIRGNTHLVCGLYPVTGESETGLVIAKQTFSYASGRAEPAAPKLLEHDIRDPDIQPRMPTGSDYWIGKPAVDVVVKGMAFAPGGTPTYQMSVSVKVDRTEKSVMVTGDRVARFDTRGVCEFSRPEPFTQMPITWDNAYGGIDKRVPVDEQDPKYYLVQAAVDHPGLYPRNPFGKGYLVDARPNEEYPLPNVEDPKELLTPQRMVTGDPAQWWRQPLSWGLDFVHPMMYPRYCFAYPDTDAWFRGPEDERMPEIARGFLQAGYRSEMSARPRTRGPHPWFLQGGSHGLIFPTLATGAPIKVKGMHPKRREIKMEVPAPPRIVGLHEKGSEPINLRMSNLVIWPHEETISATWSGTFPLPRVFVPGVHKRIPVAAKLEGFDPVAYPTPPTVKETLAAAQRQAEN